MPVTGKQIRTAGLPDRKIRVLCVGRKFFPVYDTGACLRIRRAEALFLAACIDLQDQLFAARVQQPAGVKDSVMCFFRAQPVPAPVCADILTQLETTLTARNLPVFFSIHSPGEILLLVFDSEGAQKAQTYLKAVCEEIPRALHGFDFFLIGIGSLEQGLQQVRHSYEAAQVSLEFGFYGKHGSVVNAKGASTRPVLEPHLPDLQAYMRLIQSGKKEESILSLKSYTENLYMQPIFPVQKVRHFYLRVIFQLEQLSTFNEKNESFLQQVESALYLQDMAAAAMQQLSQYWESSSSMVPYSASVRSIMDFISIHYMEPDLCIESISRHVLLSVSYVCSIFKSETKQTVNQYLTAYRIQKAKQLLQDSRYRVVDIMLRVGFNNANYFSKVFRKLEGCTPSEYREKYTK